jgi:glycosyltransferase involved in cell wall biosynthesis
VIPCRNEARSIGALLDALAIQTLPPDDILIVDDQSTDASVSVVDRWQRDHPGVPVRVVAGPGRGPGPAMNAGIAATTTDVVVRLDGHCVPDPDYIEQSVRALSDSKTGVAGGVWRVRAANQSPVARAIALVVSHPLGSGGARYRHPDASGPESMPVETVPFGAFPRTLWDRLGGFDESLAANQDFDFNYRARLAGFHVVLDRRIKATYVARATLDALWRQYFRYGFWKFQMLRKDARAIQWRQVLPILILPWTAAALIALALWPSRLTVLAAGLYPAVLLLGAFHLAARGARVAPALAALATVHLGWSAGFWRAAFGGRPPVR